MELCSQLLTTTYAYVNQHWSTKRFSKFTLKRKLTKPNLIEPNLIELNLTSSRSIYHLPARGDH